MSIHIYIHTIYFFDIYAFYAIDSLIKHMQLLAQVAGRGLGKP